MPDPIRVGLIRCDTHGAYYAAQMDKHDPLLLRNPIPNDQERRESWQHGGAYYYHYTHYCDARRMTVDFVEGFRITKMWDEHRELAEQLAHVFHDKPKVVDTLDEVSDDVDLVFIADCNGDGKDHVQLASPGLTKGVPTFIDKPFAYTVDDAVTLLNLAASNKVPLYCMSILGALPQTHQFRSRLPEVGPLQAGTVMGGGRAMAGHIHAIVLALTVFGTNVKNVYSTGGQALDVIHLDWEGQPDRPAAGVTLTCHAGDVWHCALHCSASGPMGAIFSSPLSDFVFPFGSAAILRKVREMLQTRVIPDDLSVMLEGIAVAEAARQAHRTGKAVQVSKESMDKAFTALRRG